MTTVYIDTETHLIQPGLLAPPPVCLQFAIDDGPVTVVVMGVDPVEELLEQMLQDATVVGQNLAYDTLVLMRWCPALIPAWLRAYDEDRCTCTIVREKLIHIRKGALKQVRGFSLEALSERYGGPPKHGDDPWRLRYSELEGQPFDTWSRDAQAYAMGDVTALRHVYQAQEDPGPDEYRQARAALAMHNIGANGIWTDRESVELYEAEVNTQYLADQSILAEHRLVRASGSKDTKLAKARMEAACGRLGVEPRRTEKGNIQLDDTATLLSGDEVLRAYSRYSSAQTQRSRVEALKHGYDTPLNPYFDPLKETGRTSCRMATPGAPTNGAQMQNMTRVEGERECFIGEEGEVFIATDIDGCEQSALAQVCLWTVGHSELAKAINTGVDTHVLMASQILGSTYEDTLARYRAGDKEAVSMRQRAKAANFGFPGGLGAGTFIAYAAGYGVTLTKDKALDLKEGWKRTWPEMVDYFDYITEQHRWYETGQQDQNGRAVSYTTVTQLGSERVRGRCSFTSACNTYFQGLAADGAKDAAWELFKAEQPGGTLEGWKAWNFIHDEFLHRGPRSDVDRAAREVKRIMTEAMARWMPDVPPGASPTAMHRWSKKAKTTYNDAGELIPWEEAAA